MLEKIGLPPKPSLRGNNWVVDASHCQGCSSQFTFINRKHHCRRCGGIFCGSCTQQRMVLRGQGDSPVRICEPCKKLEEAARFEMRYGHKSRASKGGSRFGSKKDDDILNQSLGNEDRLFSTQKASASCSNIQDVAMHVEGGNVVRNLSLDQHSDTTEIGSATPEDLRQQALIEKGKYRTLKAEGKSEEALRAFKRGKELERQAAALEITLRKSRKRALSSSNADDILQIKDELKMSGGKNKLPSQKSKEKDDLSAELKELGWSDLDLHDAEKRPTNLTLEGELSSLLREVNPKPNKEKRATNTDKPQVLVHKKKALELKRAGNLVEAKEELKKAKILERKIEEEELLGESDESDDELSLLMRSMDADDHNDLSARYTSEMNFDFNNFVGIGDDLAVDGNFEVTDEDMDDPEISSALKSLGWTEEDAADSVDLDGLVALSKRESMQTEIQSLKREALSKKRAGNTAEAMALLRKAKSLEVEIENSDTHGSDLKNRDSATNVNDTGPKLPAKSKLTIQKELIALKKNALSLRRQGKLDESEEELKKAKVLEEQLEEMNKAPTVNRQTYNNVQATLVDGDEEEVTDHDLHDPAYLSLLKNLGWDDEDNVNVPSNENKMASTNMSNSSITQSVVNVEAGTSRKSKSEIQRELLTLKRKALTLRRQGETEEADEVLKLAKSLEAQLQDYEELTQREDSSENHNENSSIYAEKARMEKSDDIVHENEKSSTHETHSYATVSQPHVSAIEQEILAHKRKAVALKRDGKLAEAKEELRQAKLLEKHVEDVPQMTTSSSDASTSDVSSVDKEASPGSVSKPLSSRDRFKLQQESLAHKRQALKLRREGKTAEADAEFELAKALESQLQEADPPDSSVDDVSVEDFLDPQLLSALQLIGLEDDVKSRRSQGVQRAEPAKSSAVDGMDNGETEREQLVERIMAEKVKAVNLKRSGKQVEALDALRRAKLYEKKLQSLTSK
ncbi:hypothetical protein CDL12_09501 [Handroanthus impetiginosus]|uniref:FYVE-type domain-containing protein n=1 Tax=Handroanthus impetiginosus TaxID=429701 RepID=A0A2G9HJX7_9LAMI|nr:hypothetical protein CDL12_09501 [Handroanthus impetiginosus]